MIIALLRFIYLTLPNCAGIKLKTLSKEEKQRKNTKAYSPWRVISEERRVRGELRQKVPEITRLQLATAN